MKLMKKLVVLMLALAMTCAFSVTAFAVGSPSGTTDQKMQFRDTYATEAEQKAAEEVKSNPEKVLKEAGVTGNYKFLTVFDAYLDEANADGTVTGTVYGIDVKASDKVVVLHFKNGAWIQESGTAGDGSVTMTLHGCSPVAIFKAATETPVSPATGEVPMTATVVLILLAGAGMFFFRRKTA